MSQYYIVVLVPQPGGGWRVHFPDFPGCRAEGVRVEMAIDHAISAVRELINHLNRTGMAVPSPRSYEEVRSDDAWARERGIDWSTAVISLVDIGAS
jgi:predicted RNase H-like HicB family nuclease